MAEAVAAPSMAEFDELAAAIEKSKHRKSLAAFCV